MEASGTSGQKAAINGVVNFSILDGWWAEGYNGKNGWAIGTNAEYESYDIQDNADSQSIYEILENEIIPAYYNKDKNGISAEWIQLMKNSIMSNAGKFSTSRMLVDYTEELYMPLCKLTNQYYNSLEDVAAFNEWKENLYHNWDQIEITQENNLEVEIEADGGINEDNAKVLKDAGCDIIVAGTSIVSSNDYKETVRKLKLELLQIVKKETHLLESLF